MRDKALWISRLEGLDSGAGFAFRELLTAEEVPEFQAATIELGLNVEARVAYTLDKVYVRIWKMGEAEWESEQQTPIPSDSSTIQSPE